MTREDSLAEWIDRHLDGLTTEAEASALSQRLEQDPAARVEYLRLASIHAALVSEALYESAETTTPVVGLYAAVSRRRWNFNLSGLAAGIVLGVMSASLVWAYALPSRARSERQGDPLPLIDGGFESGRLPNDEGVPTAAGLWSGDFTDLINAEQGVAPHSGTTMLRFLRPDNQRSPSTVMQRTAELWQIVDLRPLRRQLGSQPTMIEFSAWFAAAPQAAANPAKFGVTLAAFSGDPASADEAWRQRHDIALAEASKDEAVGQTATTWRHLVVQAIVPPEADFLLVQARVGPASSSPLEFAGHYLDEAELQVIRPVEATPAGVR